LIDVDRRRKVSKEKKPDIDIVIICSSCTIYQFAEFSILLMAALLFLAITGSVKDPVSISAAATEPKDNEIF